MTDDAAFMGMALALARRGMGETWPNPTVGCVFVDRGRVVARGRTAPGGRPHAEAAAIEAARQAGRDLAGTTAYVSLEPCSHHGRTPPCADALVEAGVARVVVATGDPDPRVGGGGLKRLRDAGIAVVEGVRKAEADELNAGFFLRVREGRPLVTLKFATSLDGRIATGGGESKWITGEEARARGQLLRATHDAIIVGIGTALADDPELTCRLPGLAGRSPVRVVVDSKARLVRNCKMVAGAGRVPVWLVCTEGAETTALADAGVEIVKVPATPSGTVDLPAALAALGARGLTRVLVEGGGRLAASLVAADLVDRLAIFRAGLVIGGDGLAAVAGYGLERLELARRYTRQSLQEIGADALETWARGH
ncbi:MAG: bifunctional diaminohydroxyphosphoribosylaminopyrimidine deaminase/5-amino-6-(5-phosphoribosylamino)uracil reductase RibD [Alphaproteobacteria bacterium]|nr:bifunctional diaminohydroxyphosphoribosylaminopyrimidine deaminase/5-amino-6-(5-phosphoribosylamino)uracil reductase RibD [Alphaproteobacteria bacterium]MCW5739561.1 bifunctional diaminohydroxyphosphoribosylaminopyrimidine deaminase/5-amino-6-(5-phosphoribosylamino)uracil reductase RibD [Alphaproteobacteria bacterium]